MQYQGCTNTKGNRTKRQGCNTEVVQIRRETLQRVNDAIPRLYKYEGKPYKESTMQYQGCTNTKGNRTKSQRCNTEVVQIRRETLQRVSDAIRRLYKHEGKPYKESTMQYRGCTNTKGNRTKRQRCNTEVVQMHL